MVDRQAIADEIFSVSEGSLATHKVWLLVNFIERMLADRPEAPAQTSCDNSSGQKVIAVPSCVPAPVCSKCGNTLSCVSCYNEAHAPAPLAAKEREWWVRLGKFRKALDAAGLHGHYNLLQEHFQDESGKWEAKEREIETLKAQVERAEKSCSQLADGVVRYKAQVERLSAPLSLREYYDVSLMGDSNTQFDLLKRVIAARAAEKGPSNER